MEYVLKAHSFSFDWALTHEGYKMEEVPIDWDQFEADLREVFSHE